MLVPPDWLVLSGTLLIGAIVGSFLNVVILRLPVMMQREWRAQCRELRGDPPEQLERFDLIQPGSRCPGCGTPIKPWHNIPVLGYFLLGGKCAHCGERISGRYPTIEFVTAVASLIIAWRFGWQPQLLFALILTWALIALTVIDLDEMLLPDQITLPVLWLGLLINSQGLFTDPVSAIVGGVAGYLSLWSVYQLFRILTGKEGMGFGDFKLFALIGAWLGWQLLPQVILLSSLVGALVGLTLVALKRQQAERPIPFGPYLAAAGWLALLFGADLNAFYFDLSGL